jgi:hypothetical protein
LNDLADQLILEIIEILFAVTGKEMMTNNEMMQIQIIMMVDLQIARSKLDGFAQVEVSKHEIIEKSALWDIRLMQIQPNVLVLVYLFLLKHLFSQYCSSEY